MSIDSNDVIDAAPALAAEDPARIERFILRAAPYINTRVWGNKSDYAHALFTAHLMATSGLTGTSSPSIPSGPVTQESVGDLSTSYATSTVAISDSSIASTSYGRLFLQLRASLLITPLIIN